MKDNDIHKHARLVSEESLIGSRSHTSHSNPRNLSRSSSRLTDRPQLEDNRRNQDKNRSGPHSEDVRIRMSGDAPTIGGASTSRMQTRGKRVRRPPAGFDEAEDGGEEESTTRPPTTIRKNSHHQTQAQVTNAIVTPPPLSRLLLARDLSQSSQPTLHSSPWQANSGPAPASWPAVSPSASATAKVLATAVPLQLQLEPGVSRHMLLDRQRRAQFKIVLQQLANALLSAEETVGPTGSVPPLPSISSMTLSKSPFPKGDSTPAQAPRLLTSQADIISHACKMIKELKMEKETLTSTIKQRTSSTPPAGQRESSATSNSTSASPAPSASTSSSPPLPTSTSSLDSDEANNVASVPSPTAMQRCNSGDVFRGLLFAAGGVCALRLSPDNRVEDVNELYCITLGMEPAQVLGARIDGLPLEAVFYLLPSELVQVDSSPTAQSGVIGPTGQMDHRLSDPSEIISLFAHQTLAKAPIVPEYELRKILPPTVSNPSSITMPGAATAAGQTPSHYLSSSFFQVPNTSSAVGHNSSHAAAAGVPHYSTIDPYENNSVFRSPTIVPCPGSTLNASLPPSLHGQLSALLQRMPLGHVLKVLCRQPTTWGEVMESIVTVAVDTQHAAPEQPPPLVLITTPDTRRLLTVVRPAAARTAQTQFAASSCAVLKK